MRYDEEDASERERRRRRRHERARWYGCGEPGGRWGDRKERVLHTRISEGLAEDIREVADELRVPVSNLVRNVLEDVFSVVEAVTGNVGDIIDEVVEEAGRARETLGRRARRYARDARRYHDEHVSSRPSEAGSGTQEPAPEIPEFPDVVGWQPLILNASKECAACHRSLKRGIRAFVGLTEAGLSTSYLCRRCAGAVAARS